MIKRNYLDIIIILCSYIKEIILIPLMEQKYLPSDVEKEFIYAFENLRHSLLEQLIGNKERDLKAWKPFWEIQSLLHRLYNGEEEIIGTTKQKEFIS